MNIEELARQAGFSKEPKTGHIYAIDGHKEQVVTTGIERFAALVKAEVLEQAAQTTDDGSIEGRIFAQAIRAMKPNR